MATEKVTIFELDINVDLALKDSIKLKEEIALLQSQANKAKKEQGELSEEYLGYSAALKTAQKDLRVNTKLTEDAIQAGNAEAGSINQMRKELSIVSVQWAKLSKEERENSDIGKNLTKRKKELTEALKAEEKATGDTRRNVGNYADGITEALGATTNFIPGAAGAAGAAKTLGVAFTTMTGPIGLLIAAFALIVSSLKAFFTSSEDGQDALLKLEAIFKTVVGNIVDLLSAFGKALLEPKKTLEEVKDFINDTLGNVIVGIFKGAFARIGSIVAKGALMWEEFKDNFTDNADGITEAQDRIARNSEAIEAADAQLAKGLDNTKKAYDNVKDSITDLVAEQEREIAIAVELARLQAGLDKAIRAQLVEEAKGRLQISKLRAEAADRENNDAQTRIELLEEAQALERGILEENVRIQELKLKIKQDQNALSNSTKEDLEEEARLQAEVFRVQEQAYKQIKALEAEKQTAIRQNAAETEALNKAAAAAAILALEEAAAKRQELKDIEAERQLLDAENEYILAQDNIFKLLDLERQGLEEKRLQEIAYAESIGADTTAINEKYNKYQKEIDAATFNAKLSLAKGFANDIATIAGEGTVVGKAAAAAAATINTYQAATGAYASLSPIPIVGPALGIAAAAAAVTSGIANVKKIYSTKTGLPGDKSGGGGSISAAAPSAPQVPTVRAASSAGDINQGIVSRDSTVSSDGDVSVQPTLVTDEVTVSQSRESANNQTSTI